jgi:hypothetical protein
MPKAMQEKKKHRRHWTPRRCGAAPGVVDVESDAGRTPAPLKTEELWATP